MKKLNWIKHHGFEDSDMFLIDSCLEFGGKIVAINDFKLDYEIVKIKIKCT